MPFYRCNSCDNMCTAEVTWNIKDSRKRYDGSKLYCPVTGKRDAGFREVDPAAEDPCFACTEHCPAHDCARKKEFEECIRSGYTPDDEDYEEELDDVLEDGCKLIDDACKPFGHGRVYDLSPGNPHLGEAMQALFDAFG